MKKQPFFYRHRDRGVPYLIQALAIANAFTFIVSQASSQFAETLIFNLDAVLQGDIWRVITFAFVPVGQNTLFLIFFLLFSFRVGRALENSLGILKVNLYVLFGIIASLLVSAAGQQLAAYLPSAMYLSVGVVTELAGTSHFLFMSFMFAYGTVAPDDPIMFMLFIPAKAWHMAVLSMVFHIYLIAFISPTFMVGTYAFLLSLVALFSYFIFCGKTLLRSIHGQNHDMQYKRQTSQRRREFEAKSIPKRNAHRHKCAVCEATDITNPELEFRYCSQCSEYLCYCSKHLFNHDHR